MPYVTRILPVLIVVFSTAFSQESLIKAFSELSSLKSFSADVIMEFHVLDNDEMVNFSLEYELAVRNMEDFAIKILKPDMVKGIEFVYIHSTKRVYSKVENFKTVDIVSVNEDPIKSIILTFIDILSSPIFHLSSHSKNNDEEWYIFTPTAKGVLKRLGMEPIDLVVRVKYGFINCIEINSDGTDEKVVMRIRNLRRNVNIDRYFNWIF